MNMKKIVSSLMAAAMVMTISTSTAFAATTPSVCDVADCYLSTEHTHDGTTYAGHHSGDGHENHQVCDVSGCKKTGTHNHDGVTYNGHTSGDGHTHHNSSSSRSSRHGGHRSSGRHH